MTDSTRHQQQADDGDSGNITQTLKRLSLPAGGEPEDNVEWAVPRTVLLISRDSNRPFVMIRTKRSRSCGSRSLQ